MNLGRDRLLQRNNLGRRIGRRLLAKVPLDAEMYRRDDGDNGHGAQHQDREENFNYHRNLGYQNAEPLPNAFLIGCRLSVVSCQSQRLRNQNPVTG